MVRIQISLSSRLPISRALREGSLERVLGIFIFNKANLGQREFTLPSVDVCSPVVAGVRSVGSSHGDCATHSRHTSSETVIIRAVRVEQYSAGRASRAPAAHWFVKEIGRSAVVEPGFDLECTRRAHNDSVTHYRCRGAKAKAGARAADAPTDSAICAAVSPRSNRAPSHSTWSAGHRRRGAAEERFGGWRLVMPGYISRFSQSYVIVGKYVRKILKS